MFSFLSKITPVWTAALAVVFCLSISAKADAAEGDPCDLSGSGDGREVSGGLCVPPWVAEALDKCQAAGWGAIVSSVGAVTVSCRIPVRMSAEGSQNAESCGIYAGAGVRIIDRCAEAFGVGFNFPRKIEGVEQRFVYNCPDGMFPDPDYVSGGTQECVCPDDGTLPDPYHVRSGTRECIDDEELCKRMGGEIEEPVGNGEKICSKIDDIDTFCIVDSSDAFPCRGLLKHVQRCNLDYNRPAENPFFCGTVCGTNQVATGGNCECAPGFTRQGDGACAAPAQ